MLILNLISTHLVLLVCHENTARQDCPNPRMNGFQIISTHLCTDILGSANARKETKRLFVYLECFVE